jgi:hypothetical protein
MAMVASHKQVFTYYQCDRVDNHQYYQEFCTLIVTIETYGGIGAIGITLTFRTNKIKEQDAAGLIQDATNPTNDECLPAIKLRHDKFLGAVMLIGANKEQFGALKTDLSNQYSFGNDLYPKSPNQYLSLFNHRTLSPAPSPHMPNPPAPAPIKQEDKALVFAQGADNVNPSQPKDEGSYKSSSSSSALNQ